MVEAGDILAGEDSVRRYLTEGANKELTPGSDLDTHFIPESRMPQTDSWHAKPSRQVSNEVPVGDDPLVPPIT